MGLVTGLIVTGGRGCPPTSNALMVVVLPSPVSVRVIWLLAALSSIVLTFAANSMVSGPGVLFALPMASDNDPKPVSASVVTWKVASIRRSSSCSSSDRRLAFARSRRRRSLRRSRAWFMSLRSLRKDGIISQISYKCLYDKRVTRRAT